MLKMKTNARRIGTGRPGPVTLRMSGLLKEAMTREAAEYRKTAVKQGSA